MNLSELAACFSIPGCDGPVGLVAAAGAEASRGYSFGRDLAALPLGIALGLAANHDLTRRGIRAQSVAAVLALIAGLAAVVWLFQIYQDLRLAQPPTSGWAAPLLFLFWGAAAGVVIGVDARLERFRWHGVAGLVALGAIVFILL